MNFAVTDCPNVKLVPETENFAESVGNVLSIGVLYGPWGREVLLARSVTVCTGMLALIPEPVTPTTVGTGSGLPTSTMQSLGTIDLQALSVAAVPGANPEAVPGAVPFASSLAVQVTVGADIYQPFNPFGVGAGQLRVGNVLSTPNAMVRYEAQFAVASVNWVLAGWNNSSSESAQSVVK